MLEQLRRQDQKPKDEYFREVFIQMIAFMRMTQLMIQSVQQTQHLQEDKELKPLKRFSQEVFVKLNWFFTTVKKMAGEEAAQILDDTMSFDSDKLNDLSIIAGIILESQEDISPITDLICSPTRRKRAFWECWQRSRVTVSPDVKMNEEAFESWYNTFFNH